jgi:histidinol dehydrogenase
LNGTVPKIVDLTSYREEEIPAFYASSDFFPTGYLADDALESVRGIIRDVRERGDAALSDYGERFDHVRLSPSELRLTPEQLLACARGTGGSAHGLDAALRTAVRRVREFHEREPIGDGGYRDGLGNWLGRKWSPVGRVGIYIPGGTASYPSTLIMTAVPALVAGVKEISIVSPPSSFVPPSVLARAVEEVGGISSVYRVGGVHAIAALAFGTPTVEKVDKIVGPGNRYVTLAKKELFGYVDIDMLAGPSEVLVIADGSVDPRLTAADLLAQAEHDEEAGALCVTVSAGHAAAVQREMTALLGESHRRNIIEASLKKRGKIFVVRDAACAVALANAVAPEHLELHVEDPHRMLEGITNAGAIFLGRYSPEVLGDYVAGPSHVLPTGGTARFFSPLSVRSFMKFSSVIDISARGMRELGPHASVMAEAEGLASHARSVHLRKED